MYIAGAKTSHLEQSGFIDERSHITACLVRDVGEVLTGVGRGIRKTFGCQSEGQKLRKTLKERGLWRKHHKYGEGDQYYQLGDEPEYRVEDMFAAYGAL